MLQYSKKVMGHFKKPKNVGVIKNPDGVGVEGNTRCGDIMEVYIKVKDNVIKDVKFKTFGCVAAIASSDALCDLAKGKTIEEAEKISDRQIAEYLGGLPCIKFHCSVLGSRALHAAIADYRKKLPDVKKAKK